MTAASFQADRNKTRRGRLEPQIVRSQYRWQVHLTTWRAYTIRTVTTFRFQQTNTLITSATALSPYIRRRPGSKYHEASNEKVAAALTLCAIEIELIIATVSS